MAARTPLRSSRSTSSGFAKAHGPLPGRAPPTKGATSPGMHATARRQRPPPTDQVIATEGTSSVHMVEKENAPGKGAVRMAQQARSTRRRGGRWGRHTRWGDPWLRLWRGNAAVSSGATTTQAYGDPAEQPELVDRGIGGYTCARTA